MQDADVGTGQLSTDMSHGFRALTSLFGNGVGANAIGKISSILTKIGKFDIVLMYDVSQRPR